MASRRERRSDRKAGAKVEAPAPTPAPQPRARRAWYDRLYHDHYKRLLIIPIVLLLLALLQLGLQYQATGDFINKGVSLKGGLTITVPVYEDLSVDELNVLLSGRFPGREVIVRGLSEFGELKGVSVEVEADTNDREATRALEAGIISALGERIPSAADEYSVEEVGPSLGQAFFTQTVKAVVIAFVLMGMVVFFYFGENAYAKSASLLLSVITSILIFKATAGFAIAVSVLLLLALTVLYIRFSPPSSAVILAALSDIVITLAIVNLLGIKLSTAGIAAFLMLIGYSVDTDILLSTRVLRHTQGTVYERIISSLKTGMTMSVTSLAAALIGFLVSQSDTIKQIMLIIAIGLAVDMINTWLQNTAIIRIYAEKKEMKR